MARPTKFLGLYQSKRDFKKTSEPRGKPGKAGAKLTYMIQKHAARRLHFDFRLEMDGVLKSWAVTRGPSLNPSDKRLAVHVEDHPLEYATFEGTIPQGQYGGGTVMLWDEGVWEPIGDPHKDYAKGRLTFILHGKRLKGEWHLVRMLGKASEKHDNWLLIKSHDKFAKEDRGEYAIEHFKTSVKSGRSMEKISQGRKEWVSNREQTKTAKTLQLTKSNAKRQISKKRSDARSPPSFVAPQLATLVTDPPNTVNWVHEIKFDGYRALCRIDKGNVKLLTRANNDWTTKFEEIAELIQELPIENAFMDGEIIALSEEGTMSFHNLQDTLSRKLKGKLHYHLFDLLFLNEEDLRDKPLLERKEILQKLIPKNHAYLHFSEHFENPGTDVLRHACHIALEGIVSKRKDAPYHSGRSEIWLKSKCTNEQEFVIGGFTCQPKHPGLLGAMLIGTYEGKELRYAGKVGTGFNRQEAQVLIKKFRPLKREKPAFISVPNSERRGVTWLAPEIVAAIAFTEWTPGGALRHPSFQGLREDKPAQEVKREKKKKLKRAMVNQKSEPKLDTARPVPKLGDSHGNKFSGITLTHPDKVLYPEAGITKKDLAEYYTAIADWILPHIANRPISLVRCPEGEGKPCFFQRHSGEGSSENLKPVIIDINGTERPYFTITDEEGLLSFIQMGALEIHIWGSRADRPRLPDRLVFDFDPEESVPWKKVQAAALEMKERLKDLKLECFLKATGGKGLHVVAPIERKHDWKTIKTFTRVLAQQMAKDAPDTFTINSRKAERVGRIFIDYLRNDQTASAIAPYSTRARPGAPVAIPLSWKELKDLKSAHTFTMSSTMKRLSKIKDPWEEIGKLRQALPLKMPTPK